MGRFRPWRNKDSLEIIVIGDGFNNHLTWYPTRIKGPVNIGDHIYNIDPKKLILEDSGFIRRRVDWLRRVRYRFKLFYKKGEKEPLGPGEAPLRSAELLFKVHRSKAIRMTFQTMFKTPFSGGRWAVILAIGGGVAILAYLIYTGQLEIPGVNV